MPEKVLVLYSGGLDSTLAVKTMLDNGFQVEAVHYTTPFCNCDKCNVQRVQHDMGIPIHNINMGEEYLKLVADPPHGYGSQMNICIDCRIMMFRKAKKLAQELGAKTLVTGEVIDQRPFSQKRNTMTIIEREAGVENMVLRPLSGKLLPPSNLEKTGHITRTELYNIHGRSRKKQMELAEKLSIGDYPCPSGGCLLTDPAFAARLRDLLQNEGTPSIQDILLLKTGRHFRVNDAKIIVGRNEAENKILHSMARAIGLPILEAVKHMGPTTLIKGTLDEETLSKAASMTARYSDAPASETIEVKIWEDEPRVILTKALDDETLSHWRI